MNYLNFNSIIRSSPIQQSFLLGVGGLLGGYAVCRIVEPARLILKVVIYAISILSHTLLLSYIKSIRSRVQPIVYSNSKNSNGINLTRISPSTSLPKTTDKVAKIIQPTSSSSSTLEVIPSTSLSNLASTSNSSSTCYDSPYLMNLRMSSSDESSLSWKGEATEVINIRYEEVSSKLYIIPSSLSIIPSSRSVIVAEVVLMSLQALYEYKPDLRAIPSTTYMICYRNMFDIFILFEDKCSNAITKAQSLGFSSYQDYDNQSEEAIFGLKCGNARKTIQLADELLASLLKREEREIAYREFSDITKRLTSLTQEAVNTDVQGAGKGKQKTRIISRLKFLSCSLTFIQKNLFDDLRGRITIALETLPLDIVNIIIEYESKTINSKKSIHSSSSNSNTSNPPQLMISFRT